MNEMPVVRLSTGVRVGNFSSPHPFTFTDGTVLSGCDPERAKALMLESKEIEHKGAYFTDIELTFAMSPSVREALIHAVCSDDAPVVDIILVPLPVMQAAKSAPLFPPIVLAKMRTCRVADRVSKTIHVDRFCI